MVIEVGGAGRPPPPVRRVVGPPRMAPRGGGSRHAVCHVTGRVRVAVAVVVVVTVVAVVVPRV